MLNKEEKERLFELQQLIEDTQATLNHAKALLKELGVRDVIKDELTERARSVGQMGVDEQSTVIEGVFDGQHMIGPDGKQYTVPANYASKSKLVEGDILKLRISQDGSFVYKQIGPVERKRLVGVLVKDEEKNEYRVLAEGQSFRVLLASVTYFKGEAGDEAVILVPQDGESKWAAVENIVKNLSMKKQKQYKTLMENRGVGVKSDDDAFKQSEELLLDDGSDAELSDHPAVSEEDDETSPEHQGKPFDLNI